MNAIKVPTNFFSMFNIQFLNKSISSPPVISYIKNAWSDFDLNPVRFLQCYMPLIVCHTLNEALFSSILIFFAIKVLHLKETWFSDTLLTKLFIPNLTAEGLAYFFSGFKSRFCFFALSCFSPKQQTFQQSCSF